MSCNERQGVWARKTEARQHHGRRTDGPRSWSASWLVIEGFDIQAPGVAAPTPAPAFALAPSQMGLFFSSAIFGLALGAVIGGHLSDQIARTRGLVLALTLFGLASLATPLAARPETFSGGWK